MFEVPNLPIFQEAVKFENQFRVAVINNTNNAKFEKYTYGQLLEDSGIFANKLCDVIKGLQNIGLQGRRVSFLCNPGFEYVVVQWAIWRAGGIAVPLCMCNKK